MAAIRKSRSELVIAGLAENHTSKSIRTVSKSVPNNRTAAAFATLEGN
jgi:hypothetical protein